jgi:hypothetical protein
MGDGPGATISAAEYLERDSAAPFRSEYYGGESFAISGGICVGR